MKHSVLSSNIAKSNFVHLTETKRVRFSTSQLLPIKHWYHPPFYVLTNSNTTVTKHGLLTHVHSRSIYAGNVLALYVLFGSDILCVARVKTRPNTLLFHTSSPPCLQKPMFGCCIHWQQYIWPVRTDWISYIRSCVCPFWHQCKVASKPHFPFSSYRWLYHIKQKLTLARYVQLFQPLTYYNNSCNWWCSPVNSHYSLKLVTLSQP